MFARLRLRLPLLLLMFIVGAAELPLMDGLRQQVTERHCVGDETGVGLSVVHGIVPESGGQTMISTGASVGICAEILFALCPDRSRHLHTFAAAPLRPARPALEHST